MTRFLISCIPFSICPPSLAASGPCFPDRHTLETVASLEAGFDETARQQAIDFAPTVAVTELSSLHRAITDSFVLRWIPDLAGVIEKVVGAMNDANACEEAV